MDSITQAALGATVAGVVAGKQCNGKVLIAGALLGTLPDLDVLIDYGNDISNTVKHRGFSHSILILTPFSLILSWLFHQVKALTNWPLFKVWLLVFLCLITHPLLDTFTSYGTQLLWPIKGYFSLSSIFIIDPLYTLPLLIGVILTMLVKVDARRVGVIALMVSSVYLGWGLVAKSTVEQRLMQNLQVTGIANKAVFVTPAPLNTLLWRVVVLDGSYFWQGWASVLDTSPHIELTRYNRGHWPMAKESPLLNDLLQFTQGFVVYEQIENRLLVSDLRLGVAGNLAFRFQFANKNEATADWQLQTPFRDEGFTIPDDMTPMINRVIGQRHPQYK